MLCRTVLLAVFILASHPSGSWGRTGDEGALWTERFEDGGYEGWRAYEYGDIDHELRVGPWGKDGSSCLWCWASTRDRTDTEAKLVLEYDFRSNGLDPIPVDSTTVLQWEWWFYEERESGGLAIWPLSRGIDPSAAPIIGFANLWYGPSTLGDRARVWNGHRLLGRDLGLMREGYGHQTEVTGLRIELRFPVAQEFKIDNISLGPGSLIGELSESATIDTERQPRFSSGATADLDGDGLPEVFLPGPRWGVGRLLMGAGGEGPEVDAERRGLGEAVDGVVLFVDLDNDGDQDLVHAAGVSACPVVYPNLGHGYFGDPSPCCKKSGKEIEISCISAADVDNNGYADLYVASPSDADYILLNNGGFRFSRYDSLPAVNLPHEHRTMGVTFSDLDDDGDQDFYATGVGVLLNRGDGTFERSPLEWHGADGVLAEGAAVADLDGDGRLDIYVAVDREWDKPGVPSWNLLYEGLGDGRFKLVDPGPRALSSTANCEAALAEDFNNDGLMDVFIGSRRTRSGVYLKRGPETYELSTTRPIVAYDGTDIEGAMALDTDSDGDLDIFCVLGPHGYQTLNNSTDSSRFIRVRLMGTRSNWDAIGSKVFLEREDSSGTSSRALAVRELRATQGFQMGTSKEVHFGLPDEGRYDLRVRFPSGTEVVRKGVDAGSVVTIVESDGLMSGLYWASRRRWAPALELIVWRAGAPLSFASLAAISVAFGALAAGVLVGAHGRGGSRTRSLLIGTGGLAGALALLLWSADVNLRGLVPVVLAASAGGGYATVTVREWLSSRRESADMWDRLEEEFLSYRHTEWSENLAALCRLSSALSSDALDRQQKAKIRGRWSAAVEIFRTATSPKLRSIGGLARGLGPLRARAGTLLKRLEEARDALDGGDPRDVGPRAALLLESVDALAGGIDESMSCECHRAIVTALSGASELLSEGGVRANISLQVSRAARVKIRGHELTALIQDLIRNAVEAMRGRDERVLALTAVERSRYVEITILDTGAGLPSADHDILFAEGYSTKPGGSGFGLYYARRVLRRYGGEILVEPRKGADGARVTLRLRKTKDSERASSGT